MQTNYFKLGFALCICLAALTVPARAQQPNPNENQNSGQDQSTEPIPAYRSPLASAADNGNSGGTEDSSGNVAADNRPLAGAQDLSVGTNASRRSYWQPHAGIQVTEDSEGVTASGSSWTTWASLYGGLDLHEYSGRSALNLTYLGGGVLSNDQDTSNGITQGLSLSEVYTLRRETLTLLDQLNYLPAASSGFGVAGGLGGISLPGTGGLGLNSTFAPGQTIFTTTGQDFVDSTVLESTTTLSRRTSVSLIGGYNTQRYFDNNLLNSYGFNFQGGYNYQATRKDTLALSYIFSGFRYSNFNQAINSHIIQASYSRRVTGRLAFQLGAGPEISYFNTPLGPGGATDVGSGQLYWALNTSLQYQLERSGLSLSYSHGIGGGAGVLAGSVSDNFGASATYQLTRTVGTRLNVGYARNSGLAAAVPTLTNQTYDYWYGGAGLNRPFGRTLTLTLSYQFQYQSSNATFCAGVACQANYMRNLITVGMDWRARPRAF